MAKTWYATPWTTVDFTDITTSQKFIINTDVELKALRTWLIFFNDPTITDITAYIYSNDNANSNIPKKALYTSTNTLTKANITTSNNAARGVYFEFDNVPLNGSRTYHLVLNATGYTYSSTSHVAWVRAWPQPFSYSKNYTPTGLNLGVAPFVIEAFIGATFTGRQNLQ